MGGLFAKRGARASDAPSALDAVPDGVLLEVLQYCTLPALGRLAYTSQAMRALVQSESAESALERAVSVAAPFLAGASVRPLTASERAAAQPALQLGLGSFACARPERLQPALRGLFAGTHVARLQVLDRHLNTGNRFSAYDCLLLRRGKAWVAVYARDRPNHRSALVTAEEVDPTRLRGVPNGERCPRQRVQSPPLRVGAAVEMQYRFASTSSFGWFLGRVQEVDEATATIEFSHFGDGSKWAYEKVYLDGSVVNKPDGHATGGVRYPTEAGMLAWNERQAYWAARGLGRR